MSDDIVELDCEGSEANSVVDSQQRDAPLVFQCAQCHSIIGDSTTWTSANEILRTISLKYISKRVKVNKRLVTSSEGADIGSTFNTLECEVCEEEIGRVYKTTSSNMDHMRGMFTLYVEKLSSYQTGSMGQNVDGVANTDINDLLTVNDRKAVLTELQKLQAVVVSLDVRVSSLEENKNEKIDDKSVLNKIEQNVKNYSSSEESPAKKLKKDTHVSDRNTKVSIDVPLDRRDEQRRDFSCFSKRVPLVRRKVPLSPDKRRIEGEAKRTRMM